MNKRYLPLALQYVDYVARCGSIQRAARELNVAASAIDRQVLMIEADFRVLLFERSSKGMRPTPAGEAVAAMTQRWRNDLRRLATEIKAMQGINQGNVRIAAMDSHANGLLPALVGHLAREHPAISIEAEIMSTDGAATALINGDVDVTVAFNLSPHQEIIIQSSTELPLGCVVAPGHVLAQSRTTTLQKAASFPIVLQSRSLMIRRYLEAKHGWIFTQHRPPVVTNSLQFMKHLARSGSHIAFTSEFDVAPELLEGSLRFIPIRDKVAEPQTICVAVNARRGSRISQIVASAVAEEIQSMLKRARGKNSGSEKPSGSDGRHRPGGLPMT
ncbi:MAG TPA: LysR family transcriptional regulator [Rhabdaerophilum sp.]|nr:LysR family transcriptional regulator [Rhabdaerophilum sp.]